jgi:nitroreductase
VTPDATRGTPFTRRAPTDHAIVDLLAGRWSSRAIDPDRSVDRTQLLVLLEAARWAPSSGNVQPWRYLVFDALVPDALDRARGCLRRGNAWAHRAPVLLLSLVERYWPDSTDPNPSALHDVGAASLSLCLQAAADGLVAHQMAGFDRALARERFGLPDRIDPVAFIAIGHPGRADLLDERRRDREQAPRRRRPVAQTAFVAAWDGPALRATVSGIADAGHAPPP